MGAHLGLPLRLLPTHSAVASVQQGPSHIAMLQQLPADVAARQMGMGTNVCVLHGVCVAWSVCCMDCVLHGVCVVLVSAGVCVCECLLVCVCECLLVCVCECLLVCVYVSVCCCVLVSV